MAHSILMPKAGQSMTEGTIVTWFKKEGESVERGEPLLEIETDKANLDVEAPEAGVLRKVFHDEGEVVPVLAVLAVVVPLAQAEPGKGVQKQEVQAVRRGRSCSGGGVTGGVQAEARSGNRGEIGKSFEK